MEQLTEFDFGMADYIRQILKLDIEKVWSWGTHDSETIKNGLQFKVQGYLMTGTVKITYDEVMDLFDLELLPDDSTKPRKAILGLSRSTRFCYRRECRVLRELQGTDK